MLLLTVARSSQLGWTLFDGKVAEDVVAGGAEALGLVEADVADQVSVLGAVDRAMASPSIIAKDVRLVDQVICIEAGAASTDVEDVVLRVALVCADEGHDMQGVCILDSATVPVSSS
jgi:hypothetical protein